MPFSGDDRRLLLDVARRAIRATLAEESCLAPECNGHADGNPLHQRAGCFVSLHEISTRRLRGCVGRLEGRDAVLRGVHDAAVSVLGDPRFADDPVTLAELVLLELELTVLSPLRPAEHTLAFEPLEHGIYLILHGRGGCFLPQVARETGWNREQLLARLCTEKLGLSAPAWKHADAKLLVFDAEIIGPEPFEMPSPPMVV